MNYKTKQNIAFILAFIVLIGMFCLGAFAAEDNSTVKFTSISINTLPEKRTYAYGEKLNTSGLTINQHYSDGSYVTVYEGFTCTHDEFNTNGAHTVTVKYNGFTCSFDVWVSPTPIKTVSISTLPIKTEYYQRDTIDRTGLTLEVFYTNGSSELLPVGFFCYPETLENTGTQTITVDLYGFFNTFDVYVNELKAESVTVLTSPDKLLYYVGDTISLNGLSLSVTYNSGRTETVTSGFEVTDEPFTTAGTQTITIKYLGATVEFEVTVEEVKLQRISVYSYPKKMFYYSDETLEPEGIIIQLKFNNKKTEYIDDYSVLTFSPVSFVEEGQQKITVSYEGKSCEFYVWVIVAQPTKIAVKTLPDKTVYSVGDTLDTTGLSLEVTFDDGTVDTISDGFICAPTTFITECENQPVTVVYDNLTTEFFVTVNPKYINVAKISIPKELVLYKNDTEQLIATVSPIDATNKKVTWSTSDKDVATVDENGIVTAVSKGTAIITATTEDGSLTAECEVTVKYSWWQWIIIILLFGWIWY